MLSAIVFPRPMNPPGGLGQGHGRMALAVATPSFSFEEYAVFHYVAYIAGIYVLQWIAAEPHQIGWHSHFDCPFFSYMSATSSVRQPTRTGAKNLRLPTLSENRSPPPRDPSREYSNPHRLKSHVHMVRVVLFIPAKSVGPAPSATHAKWCDNW